MRRGLLELALQRRAYLSPQRSYEQDLLGEILSHRKDMMANPLKYNILDRTKRPIGDSGDMSSSDGMRQSGGSAQQSSGAAFSSSGSAPSKAFGSSGGSHGGFGSSSAPAAASSGQGGAELSQVHLAAYQAQKFLLGSIPDVPPPRSLCR